MPRSTRPAIDASGDAPFLPGFTRRKSLRIPAGMVDGDLDDFPASCFAN